MATAAILNKSHMIFLQGFIKFDQGISENRADKNVWKNKNNDNNSEKET
jgi:hypothetical protein